MSAAASPSTAAAATWKDTPTLTLDVGGTSAILADLRAALIGASAGRDR